MPGYLEEVYDFPELQLRPVAPRPSDRHRFKKTDAGRDVRWIKPRDPLGFGNDWGANVASALESIAIPPERYPEHPFLRS